VEYVLTNKCASIVGCSSYILELSRRIHSKWQLSCAIIAFRHIVCWYIVTDTVEYYKARKINFSSGIIFYYVEKLTLIMPSSLIVLPDITWLCKIPCGPPVHISHSFSGYLWLNSWHFYFIFKLFWVGFLQFLLVLPCKCWDISLALALTVPSTSLPLYNLLLSFHVLPNVVSSCQH